MSGLLNSWFSVSFSVGISSLFWCLRLKRFLIPPAFGKSRKFGCIVILLIFCSSCSRLQNISILILFILRLYFLDSWQFRPMSRNFYCVSVS